MSLHDLPKQVCISCNQVIRNGAFLEVTCRERHHVSIDVDEYEFTYFVRAFE